MGDGTRLATLAAAQQLAPSTRRFDCRHRLLANELIASGYRSCLILLLQRPAGHRRNCSLFSVTIVPHAQQPYIVCLFCCESTVRYCLSCYVIVLVASESLSYCLTAFRWDAHRPVEQRIFIQNEQLRVGLRRFTGGDPRHAKGKEPPFTPEEERIFVDGARNDITHGVWLAPIFDTVAKEPFKLDPIRLFLQASGPSVLSLFSSHCQGLACQQCVTRVPCCARVIGGRREQLVQGLLSVAPHHCPNH